MEKKTINTVDDLKSAAGINDLKTLGKEESIDIVRNLANINPDVLGKVLMMASPEAFANLIDAAQQYLSEDEAIKIVGNKEAIKAYTKILDKIEKSLDREDLSADERQKSIDDMLKVAEKIAEEERKKEEFDKELRSQKIFFAIVIIAICVLSALCIILAILVPGVILDICVIIFCVALLLALILFYRYKNKELKKKYKARK